MKFLLNVNEVTVGPHTSSLRDTELRWWQGGKQQGRKYTSLTEIPCSIQRLPHPQQMANKDLSTRSQRHDNSYADLKLPLMPLLSIGNY